MSSESRALDPAGDGGTITFYDFLEPPLESGDYAVTVQEAVSGTDAFGAAFSQTFSNGLTFSVQGVRFSIPPGFTYAVYPPNGVQGEFSNVLPHIIFTVNTLPWQRDPGTAAAGGPLPWLALLTFDENDPIPPLNGGTIQDLLTPPAGTQSYPGLQLEVGESAADRLVYIDVPPALFNAIVPALDELPWLAHAREIEPAAVARRVFVAGEPAPAQFSSVVTNRLPAPGNKSLCCLVSLENMAPFLPGTGSATAIVRLAVLASWSFGSVVENITFADYLKSVTIGGLVVPSATTPDANSRVSAALAKGYAAIDHHTRQGASTVSWYRGPLLPYDNPLEVTLPSPAADVLVEYDPSAGMFDVSLAAAWQLGQLLTLHDHDFATTLYNWKRSQTQQAVLAFEQQFFTSELGIDLDPDDHRRMHMRLMRPVAAVLAQWLGKRSEA